MTKREQDAFVHAFITRIGGVDEDAVAAWVRGEPVDLPYKHIEILDEALSFWLFAENLERAKIMSKKKYTLGEYLQVYCFVGGLFVLTFVMIAGMFHDRFNGQVEKLEKIQMEDIKE